MLRKFCYGLAALMTTATAVVAAPANDLCTTATPLTEGVAMPFDTSGATNTLSDVDPTCLSASRAAANDVWFTYTPNVTATRVVTASNIASGIFSCISVYTACGGGSEQLACVSARPSVGFSATAGQTVYIRYGATTNTAHTGTIMVAPPAANDLCVNRQVITPGSYAFNTLGTGNEATPCPLNGNTVGTVDIWYEYTASASGLVILQTTNCSSGMPRAQITIYDGCSGTQLACAEDTCTNRFGQPLQFTVAQGQTYVIRVATYHELNNDGPATLVLGPPTVPATDSCAAATTSIAANTSVFFTTAGATNTPADVTNTCLTPAQAAANDVWFSYLPSATGVIAVTATPLPNDYIPNISVYSSCGGGTLLGCARGNVSLPFNAGTLARVTLPVTLNQRVYIRIGADDNAAHDGTIQIAGPAAAPANDNCAGATNIANGQTITFDNTFATNSNLTSACGLDTPTPSNNFDTWYRFVASQNGRAILSTCDSASTCFVEAYSDACNGTLLACGLSCDGNDTTRGLISMPMTAGSAIRVRVSAFNGLTGPGQIHAYLFPTTTNDLCANATSVGAGSVVFQTFDATNDGTPSCANYGDGSLQGGPIPDVWYRFTPSVTGYAEINTKAIFAGVTQFPMWFAPFSSCGGQQLYCYSQEARIGMTAGQPIMLMVGTQYGFVGSNQWIGTLSIAEHTVASSQYFEGNNDASGDFTDTAVDLTARNGLTQVLGSLLSFERADVYKIKICQPTQFSAAAAVASGDRDDVGKMYIFDEQGHGVVRTPLRPGTPITNTFIPSAGVYYLVVAASTVTPANEDLELIFSSFIFFNQEEGPISSGVFADWVGTATPYSFPYVINIMGLCACPADFNGDTVRDVADLFGYINAWLAKTASADFNHDTVVDVADLFGFINAWLAGC